MLHSITDVHAHYDEAVFDTDRGEVLRTLREAGVCAIVNSGSSVPSSRRSLDLAKRFEGVYASVGVFPLEAYNVPSGWLEQISDMAEEDGCVAVGEIGLDYHLEDGAGPTYAQRETQKNVFRAQLELARRKGMPVVIHDRDVGGTAVPRDDPPFFQPCRIWLSASGNGPFAGNRPGCHLFQCGGAGPGGAADAVGAAVAGNGRSVFTQRPL